MGDMRELREPFMPYSANFMPENDRLSAKNVHYLDICYDITDI